MLGDRVRQAAACGTPGKVEKILVSGDHHTWAYDEPDTMRKALVRRWRAAARRSSRIMPASTPGRRWCEPGASWGRRDAVVVTQDFHMPRALFLADEAGIQATGCASNLHRSGYQLKKSKVREVLSRVKAIADVTLDASAMASSPRSRSPVPTVTKAGARCRHRRRRRRARPAADLSLCP